MSSPKVRSLGSWFFEKKSHPKIDQKTQAFHFGVWFFSMFLLGVGIFIIISNPSKTQTEFLSWFFVFFPPETDSQGGMGRFLPKDERSVQSVP